jgi:hypothetical protein
MILVMVVVVITMRADDDAAADVAAADPDAVQKMHCLCLSLNRSCKARGCVQPMTGSGGSTSWQCRCCLGCHVS